jgi:hypothetical protein
MLKIGETDNRGGAGCREEVYGTSLYVLFHLFYKHKTALEMKSINFLMKRKYVQDPAQDMKIAIYPRSFYLKLFPPQGPGVDHAYLDHAYLPDTKEHLCCHILHSEDR